MCAISQVHASACVPPKWRSGPRAEKPSHGGHHHFPKTVSVPEAHYYQYASDDWQRNWSPVGGNQNNYGHPDLATPNGKLSSRLQLRTLSSGSVESVDIPLTG